MNGSRYQSRGLTINYYERMVDGGDFLGDLNVPLQDWKHTVSAFGGFNTAEFTLMDNQVSLDDWAIDGLGRKIIAHDETLSPMWEGFVDSVTVNNNGLTKTYGPVSDIANRIFSIYSGVDVSVFPPIIGVRKRSPTFNDTLSQQKWGILPYILSLAGVSDANADLLVTMYMKEHSHAEKNTTFAFGGSGNGSVQVKCLGWFNTLKYPYNYLVPGSGTVPLTTRLQQIILAQPNSEWVATDFAHMQANTVPVIAYQNDDQLAVEQIRGYTAMGDQSNNRWLFGVYEDRKPYHYPVVNQIDYLIHLKDSRWIVYDANHAVVPPWRVRPGKWAFFADEMAGLGAVDLLNLDQDPRTVLIENVTFDIGIPIGFQVGGGHNSLYEQKSAKLGLRGVDV